MFQGNRPVALDDAPLTVQRALTAAREEAELEDFGGTEFLEPLEAFIRCVQADLAFTAQGQLSFRSTIQRLLVNRLRLQRDLCRHPEILEEDVSDPIMILGMPRTGTTKLQRMISADPQVQGLPLWKLLNPAPYDGEQPGNPAGRLAFARAVEDATRANADFTVSHETAATEVDEDSYLILMSFDYPLLFSLYPSDSYLAWTRGRSRHPAHAFERVLLQYLQWQDGGKKGRRWILKNPGAVGCLAALHDTFPNALFVHSHRDMLEVIPSYCRLMEAAITPLLRDVDPLMHGRRSLAFWREEMARYVADRIRLDTALDILDVHYLDLVREPMRVIRQIYSRSSMPLGEESEAAMAAWVAANRQHKYGRADYSLERYGLSEEQVVESFPTLTFSRPEGSL